MTRPSVALLAVTVLAATPAWAANDLLPLNDEFGDAATLANWSRLHVTENWGAEWK